jgi:hypothetical protein
VEAIMGQVSKKLRNYGTSGTSRGFSHWCPGCEELHVITTEGKNASGACWSFDGNLNIPTFSPSINIRVGPRPTVPEGRPDAGQIDVCHYFLRAGRIEFLGDCTHAFKGQTVDLPDLPARYVDEVL